MSASTWQPPQTAKERQQHRLQLAALQPGSAVLIHRPNRPPAIGCSWAGVHGASTGLVRRPGGQVDQCLLWSIQPAPEN